MRELNSKECESVNGGLRIIIPLGATAAWAFANRAALVQIVRAAQKRDAELDAEHDA